MTGDHNDELATVQGVKFIFFFLIPTWFLNSSKWQPIKKKLVAIFKDKQHLFFNTVNVLHRPSKIKLGKRSLTCYKVDTRMDDIQPSSSLKSKMASSYRSRCMCCFNEEVCCRFTVISGRLPTRLITRTNRLLHTAKKKVNRLPALVDKPHFMLLNFLVAKT